MAKFTDQIKEMYLTEFPDYVQGYIDYLEDNGRAEKTIKCYTLDMISFYDYLMTTHSDINAYTDVTTGILKGLTTEDIEKYMDYLEKGTRFDGIELSENASARARKLFALRNFMQYLCSNKLIDINYAKLVDVPKSDPVERISLSENQVINILDRIKEPDKAPEKSRKYLMRSMLRDYAIIMVLTHTGIRVSELVALDLDDVNTDTMTLSVTRRGRIKEDIYINKDVLNAICDYVDNERRDLDGEYALFLSSRTSDPQRLSIPAVQHLVKKFGKDAAINKNVTPHTMRRTFGTTLYANSNDVKLTASALGHKTTDTAAKYYTGISDEQKQMIRNISFIPKGEN